MNINNKLSVLFLLLLLMVISSCSLLNRDQRQRGKQKELSKIEQYEVLALFIEANKEKITGNFRNARALFAECIRRDPSNHAAYYELASLMAMDKQYDDAILLAKEALKLDPENQWYYLLLSELYESTRQYKKNYQILEKLVELKPENLAFHYELASAYLYAREYRKAIQVYDKIETVIGITEELSLQKNAIYTHIGQTKNALDEVKRLIDAFPGNPDYLLLLADAYARNEIDDKAFEIYKKILRDDPDKASVHLSLADYYRNQNKLDKSFAHLDTAFLNPNLDIETKVNILLSFFQLTESGLNIDYKEQAYKLLDIVIEKHPEEAIGYSIYGDFLNRDEKYEKSRQMFYKVLDFDRNKYLIWEQLLKIELLLENFETLDSLSQSAIELFPEQPLLYLFNGYANYNLENYEKAAKAFENGISYTLFDEDLKEEFYIYLAESYNHLEKYKESDAAFEKALKISPQNPFVLNNYSYYLALRGEHLEKAKEMSLKSNIIRPNNASFQDTYAWVLYKMGEYEEALKWLEKAIKNNGGDNGIIIEHYGDVLYKLGYKEKAIEQWEKASGMENYSDLLEQKIIKKTLIE